MRSWFLLILMPAAAMAQGLARAGETCNSQEDCMEGLNCFGNVCINRACITRETRQLSAHFNGNEFRDQLLEEAGLRKRDLLYARVRHLNDNEAFIQSTEAQTFMGVIQKHSSELEELAYILQTCADEDPLMSGEEDEETGDGEERMLESTPTQSPTQSPTLAPTPTQSPTLAPTFPLNWKTYLGFHVEGGILVDGSYSIVSANTDAYDTDEDESRSYGRWCVGGELGAGFEISLVVLVLNNREANDIIGDSFLFEFDAASLLALGFSVGVYQNGDTTKNGASRTHFEFTVGAGVGVGFGGFSYCETSYYG